MNERKTAALLLAAGTAAGLTLTYLTRRTRSRLRRPVTQALTILCPRSRVEAFIESREYMLEALGEGSVFEKIDRLEVRSAPGSRGTEVYLTMHRMGKYAVKDVLRRTKALLEAGEIPTGSRCAS